jgi:hypothetical protein
MMDHYSSFDAPSKPEQIIHLVNFARTIPGANSINPGTIRRFASDIVEADEGSYSQSGYYVFQSPKQKKLLKIRINLHLRNKDKNVRKFVNNTTGWVGVRLAAQRDSHPDRLKEEGVFDNPDLFNFGKGSTKSLNADIVYLKNL